MQVVLSPTYTSNFMPRASPLSYASSKLPSTPQPSSPYQRGFCRQSQICCFQPQVQLYTCLPKGSTQPQHPELRAQRNPPPSQRTAARALVLLCYAAQGFSARQLVGSSLKCLDHFAAVGKVQLRRASHHPSRLLQHHLRLIATNNLLAASQWNPANSRLYQISK